MKRIVLIFVAVMLILPLMFAAVSCTKNSDEPETTENVVTTVVETDGMTTVAETENVTVTDGSVPLMWRVTDNDGHTLYLFGTIHIGDERTDAVIQRVSAVLDKCDALAVEFDSVAYQKNTQQMISDLTQYVLIGSTITDYLPEDIYNQAYDLLNKAGLTPGIFKMYNMAWWAQLVDSAMVITCSDLDPDKGADGLLINRAYDKGMEVLEVESSSFQMSMLNSFDNELYLMMIEESLNNKENYKNDLDTLYELWLSGDKDALWTFISDENEEETEYTEQQLAMLKDYNRVVVDDRNLGMRDKAIEYLKSGKTVFFAVGAAHMANEKGIVKLLSDAGYTVEPFSY